MSLHFQVRAIVKSNEIRERHKIKGTKCRMINVAVIKLLNNNYFTKYLNLGKSNPCLRLRQFYIPFTKKYKRVKIINIIITSNWLFPYLSNFLEWDHLQASKTSLSIGSSLRFFLLFFHRRCPLISIFLPTL